MKERNTIQRQLTLQAVRELACHPTAEEVYRYVSARRPDVSLATVYRNLNMLSARGDITKVQMPDMADRFDHNTHPHYHLHCIRCGAFRDLEIPYQELLDQQAAGSSGYQIDSHQIVFQGLCPSCQEHQ
ncbi:MAG TPA: transcriptional repressor [Firmicutes bacterium]|nr:transcriptional repressor [Bacillota bacterium]